MRILFLLAFLSFPALADDLPEECRYIAQHMPSDDVAYKPGVDVHGQPVVSADINAVPFELPNVIEVPLTVDLIERARDLPDQYEGLEAQGDLGVLEIHSDGLVIYNSQAWSESFYAICGQELPDHLVLPKRKPEPPKPVKQSKDEERVIFGGEYRD